MEADLRCRVGEDLPGRGVRGRVLPLHGVRDGRPEDWFKFDLARDLSKIATITTILSPTNPDLTAFKQRRGKLLMYHGWAGDQHGTIDNYQQVARRPAASSKPMSSCACFWRPAASWPRRPGSGRFRQPDGVRALVGARRRTETAPRHRSIDGKVERTRPLCPEPAVARCVGTGSIDDAANFRCERACGP